MSEAKQLYDDLLSALSPLLPRMVYQDVRRVRTLAWAITGLCLTHTVRLGAWAECLRAAHGTPPASCAVFLACYIILLSLHRSGIGLCCELLLLTGLRLTTCLLPWIRLPSRPLC